MPAIHCSGNLRVSEVGQ